MMDLSRFEELMLRHRHGDGSWGEMEPQAAHHDPADHDDERTWDKGNIYVCRTCDEEVQVSLRSDQPSAG